jgi:hypothetical protein
VSKLVPIQLDDQTTLYIEAQDDAEAPVCNPAILPPSAFAGGSLEGEERPRAKGGLVPGLRPAPNPLESMQLVQNTIRMYSLYCLSAFKNFNAANLDEVTLEFGINLSADAGIPYIASGKAQSNLKITVKCSYPKPAG